MLNTMKLVATDVRGVNIPDAGHFVLEEKPVEVAEAILKLVRADR
jgi:pimeloyl-ACP methyl ester carboxylesterase